MASVQCCAKYVVFVCGNKIAVYATSDSGKVYEHQRVKSESLKAEESKDQQGVDPHQSSGQISVSDFSPSGDYFAVCDDYKQLTVWKTKTEWETVSTRIVPRRCVTFTFDHKEENVYVADKSGDVYRYSLSDQAAEDTDDGNQILGHVSMLLDAAISPDDRYIVTADRDEKIRVSCLPNSYTIQTFCLGHTQFVSRLAMIPWLNNTLLSGSGDGTVRFWDYTKGEQLHRLSLNELEGRTTESDAGASSAAAGDGSENGNGDSKSNSSGAGDGGVTAVKDKLATVICIACCRKHKLVAASVLNCPTVAIYQVSQTNKGLECKQLTTLNCGASPWSLSYDDSGRLWILRPIESQPLLVYETREETGGNLKFEELSSSKSSDANPTSKIIPQINQDTEFFQDAFSKVNFYSTLHKNQIDNTCSYLQRKQQRIDHQKLKQEAQGQRSSGKQQKNKPQQKHQKQEVHQGSSPSDAEIPVAKKVKTN